MQTEIEHLLTSLNGHFACIVARVEQGMAHEHASLHPEQVFPAASLAKVPILVELARRLEANPRSSERHLTWETRYSVTDAACVPSSGVLADLSADLQPTLYDLAHLMITISDNTASNMLLDILGMEAINAAMHDLGLAHTRLERRFMDFKARQAGRDNRTSAADMTRLLTLLATNQLPGTEVMRKILLRQNENSLLSAYLPEDALFAHKTGALPGLLHDAGVLYRSQNHPHSLVIVALTAEQHDVPLTQLTLARVGRIVYNKWVNNEM